MAHGAAVLGIGGTMKQILSLGAGVQSSTVALMSERGDLPPLDAAIFSDTGAEPQAVYDWLDWLEGQITTFPIYRVEHRNLETEDVERRTSKTSGRKYLRSSVPLWVQRGDKMGGGLRRKCTRDFKIHPLMRKVKELAGISRKTQGIQVRQWIGISTDEAHRMKPSRDAWSLHWWPLIDEGMSRQHCMEWMAKNDYPAPPRSACVFCPYHSAEEWHRLQTKEPDGYERAAKYEEMVREGIRDWDTVTDADDVFCQKIVHATPLREINWTDVLADKTVSKQLSLFGEWGNECEGMCGL